MIVLTMHVYWISRDALELNAQIGIVVYGAGVCVLQTLRRER